MAKAEPKAKTEPKATARTTFALHRHGFVRVAAASVRWPRPAT